MPSRVARLGVLPSLPACSRCASAWFYRKSPEAHLTCGPGHPPSQSSCYDLGYTTGEFGKNHLGDHTESLPTAHGFQEFWGYLYHLDAMQQVSFPDINKSPAEQGIAPPCKNTPIPGLSEVPGAVDPKTTTCLTPPRPVLLCKSSDGSEANQNCHDEGPLTIERSKTVDEEISWQRLSTSSIATIPRRPASHSSFGTTRRACTSRPCCRTSTWIWSVRRAARIGASMKPA